jgi:probable F420-dependent oxidoreductase
LADLCLYGIQGSGQLPDGLPDPGRYRAVAELAEEHGLDSIWAGEHLSFHNPILDVGVALAIFASVTSRLRLGTGVVLAPLRHPSVLAKMESSLDYVSAGRVILGVGVGGEGEKDFEAAGVDRAERGARTDETIAALRALFRPPSSHRGRFYAFDGIEIAPAPAQAGGPPIYVAGASPGALRRAGELGDGWFPYMLSSRRYASGLAALRAHAERAGRGPGAIAPAVLLFALVGDDGPGARERVRSHLSRRYGTTFEPHHVERLCIAGSTEECLARLAEYRAAGARHICLNPAGAGAVFLEQVVRLAELAALAREEEAGR